MNPFDIFFKKFSYKFPKGYPDTNNEQDILLLNELLNNLEVGLGETLVINESAEDIKLKLIDAGFDEDDILVKSSKQIRLLTKNNERQATMDKLVDDLKYKYDPDFKGSSLGAIIANDGTAILVKPKERQGGASAGLDNESAFVNGINEYTQNSPITVVLKGKNKTLTYKNITKASEVGRDTTGGKKADAKLFSGDKVVANISLKKGNASMWESADRRYKELMQKFSAKLLKDPYPNLSLRPTEKTDIYRLTNPSTGQDYSGIIITDLPNNETESIVFGTDDPKTVVVKKTFTKNDFKFKNNILTIDSGFIASNLSDIEDTDLEPILIVRHDVTRTATNGLRPIVYNKDHAYKDGAITGNRIEISYDEAIS
jgi:hypothetical protein